MSQSQCDATGLLCDLLESTELEINGGTLFDRDHANGAQQLLRERMLVMGSLLEWVSCSACGVEMARVVRELEPGQILLLCPECGEIPATRHLREIYEISLSRLVNALLIGLGLPLARMRVIEPDFCWRLGMTEEVRGKLCTWYFARQLDLPRVSRRLREQIRLDKASQTAKVITSTELPLPEGSPLTEMEVINLSSIARISQSRFVFSRHRLSDVPLVSTAGEGLPIGTTLRHVRGEGKAYIDGIAYALEPIHVRILIALIENRDHEMGREDLCLACGSNAASFSPRKMFQRNLDVYRKFIRYNPTDKLYQLVIPKEDQDWLI